MQPFKYNKDAPSSQRAQPCRLLTGSAMARLRVVAWGGPPQCLSDDLQHHLAVRIRPVLSSSPSVDRSGLRGASAECCGSALHFQQQQSVAQRRARMGRVNSTNMMQLAAP